MKPFACIIVGALRTSLSLVFRLSLAIRDVENLQCVERTWSLVMLAFFRMVIPILRSCAHQNKFLRFLSR